MLADGSFRDAQGVLQKVLSSVTEKKITRDVVEPILGVPQDELVEQFVQASAAGDTDGLLDAVNALKKGSFNASTFLLLVIRKVRLILFMRYSKAMRTSLKKEISEREYTFIESLMGKEGAVLNAEFLANLLDALQQTKFASVPYLPLEMFAFKILEE